MKKSLLDILTNIPVIDQSKGNDNLDSIWFDNERECLMIVDTILLMKTFNN